eukprot:gene46818-biopygen37428
MAGMGHEESVEMIPLIESLRPEIAVLIIEHDMDAVFRMADRISVLVAGRIIATGTPDQIRGNIEVKKAYLGDELGDEVLFGVTFEIKRGDIATLLGRNGMGKSTLLRCLCGWMAPSSGRIVFCGQDITGWPADRIARLGLALVPEGRQVFPNLSVHEHLRAFAANRSGAAEPWTVERVYGLFPRLAERAGHMGQQLSGGEQQMLAIGRAPVTNPRLLVLDE